MHPKGVFGSECTVERVVEELKGYNDFSIHRVIESVFAEYTSNIVEIISTCPLLCQLIEIFLKGGLYKLSSWSDLWFPEHLPMRKLSLPSDLYQSPCFYCEVVP